MLVECVDHSGVDVVYGDAEDDNDHILADSHNERAPVVRRSCHVALPWCHIHGSI